MMKSTLKTISLLSIIPLILGLIFFDNIKGYLRFKQYCETEGGLRVYEQLEKNVGWFAKDKNYARIAALIKGVGFVRYQDEGGGIFDVRYIGGNSQDDSSFETFPASVNVEPVYRFQYVNGDLPDEKRLGKSGYEISNFNSKKILVQYYMFGYTMFNRNNSPLDVRSSYGCFNEGGKYFDDFPRALKELATAIKL